MAGRRSGVPPKQPHERIRARDHRDPYLATDGWTELPDAPFDGDIPDIPEWITVGARGQMIYEELARLPQARLYGRGTWLELQLTLPLIERYLSRPGSENFKAIVSTLGAALRLSEDDLAKARVRIATEEELAEETGEPGTKVVSFEDQRRARLLKGA